MIIIGDIHGDLESLKKILKKFPKEKKLFIGDYVDSFTASNSDVRECLNLVIENADVLLIGNHEFNYYNGFGFSGYCTGYRESMKEEISKLLKKHWNKFKLLHYDLERRLIYTHAGISQTWVDFCYDGNFGVKEIKNLSEINVFDLSYQHAVMMISAERGGTAQAGGPLWCDWRKEFEPLKTFSQVMGHTAVGRVMSAVKGKIENYNIDCLMKADVVLEVPDDPKKKIREISL